MTTLHCFCSFHPRFTDADLPAAFLARVRAGTRRMRTPAPSRPLPPACSASETRRRRSPIKADPPDRHRRRRSDSRRPPASPVRPVPKTPIKSEIKEEQPSGSEEPRKRREKKRKIRRRHQSPPPDEKPGPWGAKGGTTTTRGLRLARLGAWAGPAASQAF